jgi:AAA family ATP:ADP antiporter
MTTQSTTAPSRPSRWLRRYVNVEPAQIAALLASFAMFFALLFAWYSSGRFAMKSP